MPEPLVAAWLPFARCARRCACTRERRFDCVITTSPPESAHAVGLALQRRGVPWVADMRDAWTFESLRPRVPDRRSSAASTSASSGAGSAPPTRRLRLPSRRPTTCARRGIAEPLLVPNGWDPELRPSRRRRSRRGLLDPERVSLVYTGPLRQLRARPGAAGRGARRLARDRPGGGGAARAGDRRPADRGRGGAVRDRRLPGPDRARRQPRPRAGARAPARGRRAPAARPAGALAAAQHQAVRVPRRRAADPRARRRHRGRQVVARARRRGRARPTIRRRSPRRSARVAAGELAPPAPDAVAAYTYPAPAERWRTRSRRQSVQIR